MPTHTHHEPLSHLDATFLALESPTTHMHVGAVAVFEAEPLRRPDGGVDIDRVRRHVESKLSLIPRYRQRLAHVPYNRAPVWIDDASFDIDYHLRHTSLPRPGSEEQLKTLVGRIVSHQLDRSKPLWELWVVEGLEGDRFALVAKIHHCMVDGSGAVDLTTILLDLAPSAEAAQPAPWRPRPAPTGAELAVADLARRARRAVDAGVTTDRILGEGRKLTAAGRRRLKAAGTALRSGWLSPTDPTPLNPEIGPHRRVDWTETSLDEVRQVKDALGGTVNDVVLTTVTGAVRHFLHAERRFPTEGLEFRVMAPVSVRAPGERGRLGNQVAMWLVPLPVSEPDPLRRYEAIRGETLRLKRTDQALGASTLVHLSRGTPIPLLSLANRLVSNAIRPFNMTVTNVPGPQFPMYLLGSRMLANYPVVPLWARHGLGVALFSYDGRLLWGIQADFDAVPDIHAFVSSIHRAFEELRGAARVGTA